MTNDTWTKLGDVFLSPDGKMIIYVDAEFRFHCWIAPDLT